MELKLTSPVKLANPVRLLIVPYGIETTQSVELSPCSILLIVPYGIETTDRR